MKKFIAGVIALVMLFTFMFAGTSFAEEKKLNVVTTIFPVYDWCVKLSVITTMLRLPCCWTMAWTCTATSPPLRTS